jgi:hypothetical protein
MMHYYNPEPDSREMDIEDLLETWAYDTDQMIEDLGHNRLVELLRLVVEGKTFFLSSFASEVIDERSMSL